MLLWLTSQIGVHGLVPKLFNTLPVFDLSRFENVAQLMTLGVCHGLVAYVVVKVWVLEFVWRVSDALVCLFLVEKVVLSSFM